MFERAIRRAREVGSALTEGIALVSLTTVRARHGDDREALPLFADAVRHWHDLDDWTHQRVTLENLLILLQRLGAHESAALLLAGLDAVGTSASRSDSLSDVRLALSQALGERFDRIAAGAVTLDDNQVVNGALDIISSMMR